jgi:hypothetical protein
MPQYIIHKDGAYNFWSTIVDAPVYREALTLAEVRGIVWVQSGTDALQELEARLERAHKTGCSSFDMTLEDCIAVNRAGPNETDMPFDEVISRYLTLRRAHSG